jgi:hypothetical protein
MIMNQRTKYMVEIMSSAFSVQSHYAQVSNLLSSINFFK